MHRGISITMYVRPRMFHYIDVPYIPYLPSKKVQVGKDQEKAQSERDSHSKNRGGKKQTNNQALRP